MNKLINVLKRVTCFCLSVALIATCPGISSYAEPDYGSNSEHVGQSNRKAGVLTGGGGSTSSDKGKQATKSGKYYYGYPAGYLRPVVVDCANAGGGPVGNSGLQKAFHDGVLMSNTMTNIDLSSGWIIVAEHEENMSNGGNWQKGWGAVSKLIESDSNIYTVSEFSSKVEPLVPGAMINGLAQGVSGMGAVLTWDNNDAGFNALCMYAVATGKLTQADYNRYLTTKNNIPTPDGKYLGFVWSPVMIIGQGSNGTAGVYDYQTLFGDYYNRNVIHDISVWRDDAQGHLNYGLLPAGAARDGNSLKQILHVAFGGGAGCSVATWNTVVNKNQVTSTEPPNWQLMGRNYWCPTSGTPMPVPTGSDYVFNVECIPKNEATDLNSVNPLNSVFSVNINPNKATPEEKKAFAESIEQTGELPYEITITMAPCSENKWGDEIQLVPNESVISTPTFVAAIPNGNTSPLVKESFTNSDTYSFTITGKSFAAMLKGDWNILIGASTVNTFVGSGTPPTLDSDGLMEDMDVHNTKNIYSPGVFQVKVATAGESQDALADTFANDATKKPSGFIPEQTNGYNYASWGSGTEEDNHIPWEFHTTTEVEGYAAVVANEVGNSRDSSGYKLEKYNDTVRRMQDWNVATGIPSTENLSIAVGGTAFVSNLGGYYHYASKLNRKIKITVNILECWGIKNPRCTLSCGGHVLVSHPGGATSTDSGGPGSKCSKTSPPCPCCGKTVTATGSDVIVGGKVVQELMGFASHNCTHNYVFYCSTGTAQIEGSTCGESYGLDSVDLIPNQQRYNLYAYHYTCSCPDKCYSYVSPLVNSYINETTLCAGYTRARGCGDDRPENVIHEGKDSFTFTINEQVDQLVFREITDAAVLSLDSAKVTDVDKELISMDISKLGTTNEGLAADIWRGGAASSYMSASTAALAGRVYFTRFVDPFYKGEEDQDKFYQTLGDYSKDRDGWISTSCVGTNGLPYYLGNVNVVINGYMNSLTIKEEEGFMGFGFFDGTKYHPGALDYLHTQYIRNNGNTERCCWGHSHSPFLCAHYEIPQYVPGVDLHTGDGHYINNGTTEFYLWYDNTGDERGTSDGTLRLALHLVNAWQMANRSDQYTVNVISDQYVNGVASLSSNIGEKFQNVLGDAYAVDHGICLFTQPFTGSGQTKNYYHTSVWGLTRNNTGTPVTNVGGVKSEYNRPTNFATTDLLENGKKILFSYMGSGVFDISKYSGRPIATGYLGEMDSSPGEKSALKFGATGGCSYAETNTGRLRLNRPETLNGTHSNPTSGEVKLRFEVENDQATLDYLKPAEVGKKGLATPNSSSFDIAIKDGGGKGGAAAASLSADGVSTFSASPSGEPAGNPTLDSANGILHSLDTSYTDGVEEMLNEESEELEESKKEEELLDSVQDALKSATTIVDMEDAYARPEIEVKYLTKNTPVPTVMTAEEDGPETKANSMEEVIEEWYRLRFQTDKDEDIPKGIYKYKYGEAPEKYMKSTDKDALKHDLDKHFVIDRDIAILEKQIIENTGDSEVEFEPVVGVDIPNTDYYKENGMIDRDLWDIAYPKELLDAVFGNHNLDDCIGLLTRYFGEKTYDKDGNKVYVMKKAASGTGGGNSWLMTDLESTRVFESRINPGHRLELLQDLSDNGTKEYAPMQGSVRTSLYGKNAGNETVTRLWELTHETTSRKEQVYLNKYTAMVGEFTAIKQRCDYGDDKKPNWDTVKDVGTYTYTYIGVPKLPTLSADNERWKAGSMRIDEEKNEEINVYMDAAKYEAWSNNEITSESMHIYKETATHDEFDTYDLEEIELGASDSIAPTDFIPVFNNYYAFTFGEGGKKVDGTAKSKKKPYTWYIDPEAEVTVSQYTDMKLNAKSYYWDLGKQSSTRAVNSMNVPADVYLMTTKNDGTEWMFVPLLQVTKAPVTINKEKTMAYTAKPNNQYIKRKVRKKLKDTYKIETDKYGAAYVGKRANTCPFINMKDYLTENDGVDWDTKTKWSIATISKPTSSYNCTPLDIWLSGGAFGVKDILADMEINGYMFIRLPGFTPPIKWDDEFNIVEEDKKGTSKKFYKGEDFLQLYSKWCAENNVQNAFVKDGILKVNYEEKDNESGTGKINTVKDIELESEFGSKLTLKPITGLAGNTSAPLSYKFMQSDLWKSLHKSGISIVLTEDELKQFDSFGYKQDNYKPTKLTKTGTFDSYQQIVRDDKGEPVKGEDGKIQYETISGEVKVPMWDIKRVRLRSSQLKQNKNKSTKSNFVRAQEGRFFEMDVTYNIWNDILNDLKFQTPEDIVSKMSTEQLQRLIRKVAGDNLTDEDVYKVITDAFSRTDYDNAIAAKRLRRLLFENKLMLEYVSKETLANGKTDDIYKLRTATDAEIKSGAAFRYVDKFLVDVGNVNYCRKHKYETQNFTYIAWGAGDDATEIETSKQICIFCGGHKGGHVWNEEGECAFGCGVLKCDVDNIHNWATTTIEGPEDANGESTVVEVQQVPKTCTICGYTEYCGSNESDHVIINEETNQPLVEDVVDDNGNVISSGPVSAMEGCVCSVCDWENHKDEDADDICDSCGTYIDDAKDKAIDYQLLHILMPFIRTDGSISTRGLYSWVSEGQQENDTHTKLSTIDRYYTWGFDLDELHAYMRSSSTANPEYGLSGDDYMKPGQVELIMRKLDYMLPKSGNDALLHPSHLVELPLEYTSNPDFCEESRIKNDGILSANDIAYYADLLGFLKSKNVINIDSDGYGMNYTITYNGANPPSISKYGKLTPIPTFSVPPSYSGDTYNIVGYKKGNVHDTNGANKPYIMYAQIRRTTHSYYGGVSTSDSYAEWAYIEPNYEEIRNLLRVEFIFNTGLAAGEGLKALEEEGIVTLDEICKYVSTDLVTSFVNEKKGWHAVGGSWVDSNNNELKNGIVTEYLLLDALSLDDVLKLVSPETYSNILYITLDVDTPEELFRNISSKTFSGQDTKGNPITKANCLDAQPAAWRLARLLYGDFDDYLNRLIDEYKAAIKPLKKSTKRDGKYVAKKEDIGTNQRYFPEEYNVDIFNLSKGSGAKSPYNRDVDARRQLNGKPTAGLTLWTVKNEGEPDGGYEGVHDSTFDNERQTFYGFHRKHIYSKIGSYTTSHWLNVKTRVNGGQESPLENGGAENAAGSTTSDYGNSMVISNITLNPYASNGVYNPCTVTNSYTKLITIDTEGVKSACKPDGIKLSNASENAANPPEVTVSDPPIKSKTASVNSVLIQDPVSVEYCQVIGNNYVPKNSRKNYKNGWDMIDESEEDQRVDYNPTTGEVTKEYSTLDPKKKKNYLTIGNTFHIWVSDYGNFQEDSKITVGNWSMQNPSINTLGTGFKGQTSDPNNGKTVNSYPTWSYGNYMNTGRWTTNRYVSFDFAVSYKGFDGKIVSVPAGKKVSLHDVPCLTSQGKYNGRLGWYDEPYGQSNIVEFVYDTKDKKFHRCGEGGEKGYESIHLFHKDTTLDKYAPDVSSGLHDIEFTYGLDYKFTVLSSSLESKNAHITFYSQAINSNMKIDDDYLNVKHKAQSSKEPAADDIVRNVQEVELVGRIGNLVLEDVGDFRFSELFKDALSSWMIKGVIHNVDKNMPNRIFATRLDILLNDTAGKVDPTDGHYDTTGAGGMPGYNHATYSLTNKMKGSSTDWGKAGPYFELPLTAKYNTIKEFKKSQMRLGYDAYFDFDTIGNYWGINLDANNEVDRGPRDPYDPDAKDTRKNKIDIYPYYFLYDFDDGKFYQVSLYAGSGNNKKCIWKYGDTIITPESALYVDVPNEKERRNITVGEEVTSKLIKEANKDSLTGVNHDAFEEKVYIGTASKITLDQFTMNYIGSNLLYGVITANSVDDTKLTVRSRSNNPSATLKLFDKHYEGSEDTDKIDYDKYDGTQYLGTRINDFEFAEQVQRHHFTLGLPSSTTICEGNLPSKIGKPGAINTTVESSHEALMKKHPHSALVTFIDIIATNQDVFTLRHDARQLNGDSNFKWKFYDDSYLPDGIPPTHNEVTITEDTEAIPDEPGIPPVKIDPSWQPVVIYDPELSSATDWETFGTH